MTNQASPSDWLEDIISLLPAITLLQNLGYEYLTPKEALAKRGGKRSRIVLEEILTAQLQKLNKIEHRGQSYPFSENNIQKAVEAISQFHYDALYTTSQELYDLLTLGKSLEQIIDGDKKVTPCNTLTGKTQPTTFITSPTNSRLNGATVPKPVVLT